MAVWESFTPHFPCDFQNFKLFLLQLYTVTSNFCDFSVSDFQRNLVKALSDDGNPLMSSINIYLLFAWLIFHSKKILRRKKILISIQGKKWQAKRTSVNLPKNTRPRILMTTVHLKMRMTRKK